jgi:hypothetical protein
VGKTNYIRHRFSSSRVLDSNRNTFNFFFKKTNFPFLLQMGWDSLWNHLKTKQTYRLAFQAFLSFFEWTVVSLNKFRFFEDQWRAAGAHSSHHNAYRSHTHGTTVNYRDASPSFYSPNITCIYMEYIYSNRKVYLKK